MNAHHPIPAAFRRPGAEKKLSPSAPEQSASYMGGDNSIYMKGFNPRLREEREDVQQGWVSAAGRAVESIHNSGFLKGAIETLIASVVGTGLRMTYRPDLVALNWTEDQAEAFIEEVESKFRLWAGNKHECDAGGRMNFGQMQQAWLLHSLVFGEGLALLPIKKAWNSTSLTKISIIPPTRLSNDTNEDQQLFQGVFVDGWNAPLGYKLTQNLGTVEEEEVLIPAYDRDGRANIIHIFDPVPATTRGISPFAPILKVLRQVDQYRDATVTKAMIQTIFAATLQNDAVGHSTFDGLFTEGDIVGGIKTYGEQKADWYKGANIDLQEHGRIASLFPGDKLDMTQTNMEADDFDKILQWMMRECAAALGMSYDSFTQDDRGATYSSIRMGGAKEWQRVIKRRNNTIVPFCQTAFSTWLEEQIGTGKIVFPGGLKAFRQNKAAASATHWAGPAKPQADDFKTARAFEVQKDMHSTTMAAIADEYGTDWEDDMVQRSRENTKAEKLGLPLPWPPNTELMALEADAAANLGAPTDGDSNERKRKFKPKPKKRSSGTRDSNDPNEPNTKLEAELNASLSTDGEGGVSDGN